MTPSNIFNYAKLNHPAEAFIKTLYKTNEYNFENLFKFFKQISKVEKTIPIPERSNITYKY